MCNVINSSVHADHALPLTGFIFLIYSHHPFFFNWFRFISMVNDNNNPKNGTVIMKKKKCKMLFVMFVVIYLCFCFIYVVLSIFFFYLYKIVVDVNTFITCICSIWMHNIITEEPNKRCELKLRYSNWYSFVFFHFSLPAQYVQYIIIYHMKSNETNIFIQS